MEYLTRKFDKIKENGTFAFHPKCARIDLTHLCFADDLMVLCGGDKATILIVLQVLEEFGQTSGLYMNDQKSMIYLGGVAAETKFDILNDSGLREGEFSMRYLGIPLHHHSLRVT